MKRIIKTALVAGLAATFAMPVMSASHILELGVQEADMVLNIGMVMADTDGMIEVYDYHTGAEGPKLGEVKVHAGANADLLVKLGDRPDGDVLAVLIDTSGNRVAQSVIDVK